MFTGVCACPSVVQSGYLCKEELQVVFYFYFLPFLEPVLYYSKILQAYILILYLGILFSIIISYGFSHHVILPS